MQNVGEGNSGERRKADKVSPQEAGKSSSAQSSDSSPTKSETDTFSELQPRFMSDSSESEDEDVSEVESFVIDQGELEEAESRLQSKFLLSQEDSDHSVDPETQARLEALLEAAGIGKLATGDGKQLADPEVLRRLTSSVSCALDEAAAALTRMRNENPRPQPERSLVEACTDGDVGTVKKLLTEGRSVHETTEEGESLLSLACSAGYYELAQVLLAMHANVEDRGIKGDCTPLMEAASSGYVDIVRLLIHHGADVNAQSSSGNTPLMYACAGGHEEAVRVLLDAGANVEDHNENGHTPLMEAASAGHVTVAAILLERGAGINTHSNEFKESALTLACYKGHLDMVRFLLEAGADQEHKTDEMHTALMEASMDGHVEVARLLLDSGAQVNMPTDSFESPLTLAACGGHVDLALLLIDRGANIEEVNDEGYTPLMEAAREGHEEMVSVLLSKGANINTQTEETQETALTLACCGGFLEVADFLIKNGAELELGASTPLMEAAQEGHLDLVRYLLDANADVNAQTQTGDTALTYSCENGHTEVAKLLLQYGANLEHESEGGRTPLMKGCRAGHLCTVKFLLSQKADVNKQTTNNDHTPLSLASAGGHIAVVELLLAHHADPFHKLKDNSTMLIEAAKGGHTNVVQLLLDYPHSIMMNAAPPPPLHEIPDALRALSAQDEPFSKAQPNTASLPGKHIAPAQKSLLRKGRLPTVLDSNSLTSPEVQQVRNQPGDGKEDPNILDKGSGGKAPLSLDPQFFQRQQIVEELQRVEQELKEKGGTLDGLAPTTPPGPPPDPAAEVVQFLCEGVVCPPAPSVFHSPPPPPPVAPPSDVVQSLAISDRPKAKPAWKKEGKNVRKQAAFQAALQHHSHQLKHLAHISDQHLSVLQSKGDEMTVDGGKGGGVFNTQHMLSHVQQPLEIPSPIHLHHAPPLDRNIQELSGGYDLLQRRCPLLTDDDTIIDLAKTGKLDQATLEDTLDSLTLEDVNTTGAERERIRLNASAFMAGVEVASKALMGPQAQAPFQVVPTETGGLQVVPTTGTPAPDQAPSLQYLYNVPNTAPAQGGGGFQVQCQMRQELLSDKGRSRLESVPPPAPAPPAPAPYTPQLLLKAPPPWIKGNEGGGREQVQAGTQTSPSSSSAVSEVGKKASSGVSNQTVGGNKGKRARLQQQKSTQAPPIHLDPNQIGYGGGEALGGSGPFSCMDVDSATDSNNDTALTLACAGGHDELVELLLSRGANIEHRDKKGFTPLILAATAGHEKVVEILLNHSADMEAQSERTKDTPLSLACSGGRYEVVELLLSRGANKEHRNVSDYTPLSLAASGGYVNIIKLLLSHGAEINSRTGSKLGISPLMLAAMNGHTAAVKLLLDMGSDINAQIETNRNTALTLACFQGRHEVVSLLLDRRANVEHRAKTGLTPLMEAASGGYVEVGRVLLDKGADVNAPPVPSSRDTALTIAADKGHCRFVELLLNRSAQVEVKNKKGNSPLWLAANGGHLAVVELLYNVGADIDSQDNRKVSCLMAAFRKGHVKVVKWMVNHVMQFPSDQEMTRYISTVSDKELLEKCQECIKIIRVAKDQQAAKANKNATILLEELFLEKTREESKRAAAARRRERKKKKKLEKKEEKRKLQEENQRNEAMSQVGVVAQEEEHEEEDEDEDEKPQLNDKRGVVEGGESPGRGVGEGEEGDSGIDANSQGSCSSNEVKTPGVGSKRKEKKKKKPITSAQPPLPSSSAKPSSSEEKKSNVAKNGVQSVNKSEGKGDKQSERSSLGGGEGKRELKVKGGKPTGALVFESSRHPADREDFEATGSDSYKPKKNNYLSYCDEGIGNGKGNNSTSPKQAGKRDEGWKEVVRKYLNSPFRSKKVSVPLNAISRVIGRGGSNINAIRTATGAHIEVEKQSKGQGERIITLKGSAEATKQAHSLIAALIKDPDVDILQLLPKSAKSAAAVWEKSVNTAKSKPGKTSGATTSISSISTTTTAKTVTTQSGANTSVAPLMSTRTITTLSNHQPRVTAPRLVAAAVKRAQMAATTTTKTTMSYTSVIMTSSSSCGRGSGSGSSKAGQTFAAKLTSGPSSETSPGKPLSVATSVTNTNATATTPTPPPQLSAAPTPPIVAPVPVSAPPPTVSIMATSTTTTTTTATLEYSLFNDTFTKVTQQSMWGGRESDSQKGMNFASVAATGAPSTVLAPPPNKFLEPSPPQVDASKAPGYRGGSVCSPVSKTGGSSSSSSSSSSGGGASTTPPSYYPPPSAVEPPPIRVYQPEPPTPSGVEILYPMSRLNPRAPDFSAARVYHPQQPSFPAPPPVVSFPPAPAKGTRSRGNQWGLVGYEVVEESGDKAPPRPIGTERASWKSLQEEWGVTWGSEQRHPPQLFRPPFHPPAPPPRIHHQELHHHHIPLDTPPYQGGMDGVGGYNGGLMLPVMGHFGAADMEPPAWDRLPIQDTIHDKPHGWTTKWAN